MHKPEPCNCDALAFPHRPASVKRCEQHPDTIELREQNRRDFDDMVRTDRASRNRDCGAV